MSSLIDLTDFGDLAVTLPLAAALSAWLLWYAPRRAAPWWLASLVLCGGVTAVLKILFFACAVVPEVRSPSGHTSLSTLVYGALALVVAARAPRVVQVLVAVGAALLIFGIAASRVALHAHTLAETIVGLAIGGATLALFGRGYLVLPPVAAPLWQLLVPVSLLLVVLHGQQLRAEEFLNMVSVYLRGETAICG